MLSHEAYYLLERITNLMRVEAFAVGKRYGLQSAQLEALTYLAHCNRYSDTPQAVADFLGRTKGTVSQNLKALEEKGLLRKRRNGKDKRLIHLRPTTKGRRIIQESLPADLIARGFDVMPSSAEKTTVEMLRRLLGAIQKANGLKSFASCHTCRFNIRVADGYFCDLTQEPLSPQDALLLCREHEYPSMTGT